MHKRLYNHNIITKADKGDAVVIVDVDKGDAVVIVDVDDYVKEPNQQLDNKDFYKKINKTVIRLIE